MEQVCLQGEVSEVMKGYEDGEGIGMEISERAIWKRTEKARGGGEKKQPVIPH